jgi:hypothetical protein
MLRNSEVSLSELFVVDLSTLFVVISGNNEVKRNALLRDCQHPPGKMTDYPQQSAVGENIAIADLGSIAIVNNTIGFKSEVATSFSSGENHEKSVFFHRDRL